MEVHLDSLGRSIYKEECARHLAAPSISKTDSVHISKLLHATPKPVLTFDKILERTSQQNLANATATARSTVSVMQADLEWKSTTTEECDYNIRRHWVEWHQKMTLSLACIVFFFVGAPLGAIIRKGGLGLPTIVSIIIFIFWYIINTSGMKMARDGNVNMVLGMWISLIVIAPFGLWITYKASRDSAVFNAEAYWMFFARLLGIRPKRHLFMKEVILQEPRLDFVRSEIDELRTECCAYASAHHLLKAPSYVQSFFHYQPDTAIAAIAQRIEALVEELSNSRNRIVLSTAENLPQLYTSAHTSPFHSHRLNVAAGVCFPVGILVWLRMWRFRLLLLRDLRVTVKTCDRLDGLLAGQGANLTESDAAEQATERYQRKRRARHIIKWIVVAVILLLIGYFVYASFGKLKTTKKLPEKEKQEQRTGAPTAAPQPVDIKPTKQLLPAK